MVLDSSVDPFETLRLLEKASILVIGAGGVGCEVIKNLLLCGAKNITIVDMDTIDISNLNRQFLYHRGDVGQFKARVACQRALEVSPNCNVKAIVCNVLEWKPEDVSGYDAVLNALDNIRARSHVNYCCIHAGIPLIDSGSTGFSGQVVPIIPRLTKCYDCFSRPKTKSIPVCTIRQVPEKPEHCIAWARKLYELIFGTPDGDNTLSDLLVPPLPKTPTKEAISSYVIDLYKFLFKSEIENLLTMKTEWKRKPPKSLDYPRAEDTPGVVFTGNAKRKFDECGHSHKRQKLSGYNDYQQLQQEEQEQEQGDSSNHQSVKEKLKVYDTIELAQQFSQAIHYILARTPDVVGKATFSKDDPVCIQFIAAAANLRMLNFHIPTLSTWDVQSIAGSIIPAVAATNAIVAATQVVQLVHVLDLYKGNKTEPTKEELAATKCRLVWIQPNTMGSNRFVGNVSTPEPLEAPTPKCTICQQATIRVLVKDLAKWTMGQFVKVICEGHLKLEGINIDFCYNNIYDCEEFQDNAVYASRISETSLEDFGITDSSILTITSSSAGQEQFDMQVKVDPDLAGSQGYHIIGH